jgi:phosphatidate cytidylyltransferase
MASNRTVRVVVAAIGIPVAATVVYVGGWLLATLLALFGSVGAMELYRMGGLGGLRPLTLLGALGAAACPLAAFALLPAGGGIAAGWVVAGAAGWLMLTMSTAAFARTAADRPLGSVGVTLLGVVYAGALPAFLLPIRHAPGLPSGLAGMALVFLPLMTVWVCDSLAMEVGSRVGGPKLAPALSPKKTWSGAIGGTIGGMIAAPVYGLAVLERVEVGLTPWQLVIFGLLASVVGQVGDVTESVFKREAGVKDSGSFFPGHGGVLDRLDSLYWVLPVATGFLAIVGVL